MQDDPRRFRDLSLDAFVAQLASAAPVPGGGSASAVAASLGAALVTMVASLSENRPRYIMYAEVHRQTKEAGTELSDRLLRLADEDAAAYGAFAAAMKLPNDTPEEQAARTASMQATARIAAEVPLRCLEACVEVAEAAELLAARCNVNASSDVNVAAMLVVAAGHGAAENVLVNLPSVGDDAWSKAARERVDGLLVRLSTLAASTHTAVASGELRAPVA